MFFDLHTAIFLKFVFGWHVGFSSCRAWGYFLVAVASPWVASLVVEQSVEPASVVVAQD